MRKTICALVAVAGLAGCGNTPDYEFNGEIDGNKVSYEVPFIGLEELSVTSTDGTVKTYYISDRETGDDTISFLRGIYDLDSFCVRKGEKVDCFGGSGDDGDYLVASEANTQARHWINRISEVKRIADALNRVKEREGK